MNHVSRIALLPTVAEACGALILARLRVLGADGDRVLRSLPAGSDPVGEIPAEMQHQARLVARALAAASRRIPWTSTCLVQSLAAVRMLRRRHIPGILFLGVRKGEAGGELEAHAWVHAAGVVVCGGVGAETFTLLSEHRIGDRG